MKCLTVIDDFSRESVHIDPKFGTKAGYGKCSSSYSHELNAIACVLHIRVEIVYKKATHHREAPVATALPFSKGKRLTRGL
jgi:hypothetical protein